MRSTAFLEVELRATRAAGRGCWPPARSAPAGTWVPSAIVEGHDGTVHLPTMVPVDADGDIVAPGRLRRPVPLLPGAGRRAAAPVGLSLDNAVTTYDYSTPGSPGGVPQDPPGAAGTARQRRGLPRRGRHPDEPAAPPGALVAIDVTASRHPLELVNPGWSRYDTLTYAPGVKAGRTLFMSGFAALDMETQQALHPGDLAAQAEATYGAILHLLQPRRPRPGAPARDHRVLRGAGAAQLPGRRRGPGAAADRPVAGLHRRHLRRPAPPGVPAGGLPDRALPAEAA